MNILLIDDDLELVAVLKLALERAGFTVATARDRHTALATVVTQPPALIVLGMPLRTTDALDLLAHLRQRSQTVIIMLVGRSGEDERVAGLDLGADDYVSKPFSSRELVARIHALLRHRDSGTPALAPLVQVGQLALNSAEHTITHAGEPVSLTVTEFRLLHYLMSRPDCVVSFTELIRQVWGYHDPGATDVVRTTVYRLRRKLKDDPAEPHLLRSVPGVGFLLSAATDSVAVDASGGGSP